MDPRVIEIARAASARGARALIVGGYVRDRLLGIESKDVDVEVFGLNVAGLEALLGHFGEVIAIGRAFGVLRLKGLDVDFSLPRRDSKVGAGHRGFDVAVDPELDFATAARRRDLTINSIGLDPLSGETIDPHRGAADLAAGRLRATDPAHFAEDPLRGLRVAQFAARFAMRADAELLALCAELDLSEVSPERTFEELRKLLLKGARPSVGLELMRETGMLGYFPELAALVGVPQDPTWHPEGDVWVHTLMVADEAALARDAGDAGEHDLALMLGALCHDLGKPATTETVDGRVRSHRHDTLGVEPTRALLARIRAPNDLTDQVAALVEHHLAPALLDQQGAKPRAYRRLAARLGAAGVTTALLERVARADHFGRTTPEALARVFPAGDRFLARVAELDVAAAPPRDVVQGRHLIARGLTPGPGFGPLLERARDVQYDLGLTDPEAILDRVLGTADQ